MRINLKLRFKNKAALLSFIGGLIALAYIVLGWFGVTPRVSENDAIQAVTNLINLLMLVGVLIDPTTEGLSDSEIAMLYNSPRAKEDKTIENSVFLNEAMEEARHSSPAEEKQFAEENNEMEGVENDG